jgi:hypothetical protein
LHRARDQVAVTERARWLDELAHAISGAQWLTWRLGVVEGDSEEARALYARLEAARSEVESLRFGEWLDIREEIDPKWLEGLLNGGEALPANEG